jgi:hypothetical protein
MAYQDLPTDPVEMEAAICARIVAIFKSVPGVGQAWERERLVTLPEGDEDISTTLDPVTNLPRTDIIQVSLESITEGEYTDDVHTKITLRYRMTYDLEFADEWKKEGLAFPNSTAQFKAVLMRSRKKFKEARQLGYNNVWHSLLQMERAGLTFDDETGGRFHAADWTLAVTVSGFAA